MIQRRSTQGCCDAGQWSNTVPRWSEKWRLPEPGQAHIQAQQADACWGLLNQNPWPTGGNMITGRVTKPEQHLNLWRWPFVSATTPGIVEQTDDIIIVSQEHDQYRGYRIYNSFLYNPKQNAFCFCDIGNSGNCCSSPH